MYSMWEHHWNTDIQYVRTPLEYLKVILFLLEYLHIIYEDVDGMVYA